MVGEKKKEPIRARVGAGLFGHQLGRCFCQRHVALASVFQHNIMYLPIKHSYGAFLDSGFNQSAGNITKEKLGGDSMLKPLPVPVKK